MVLHIQSSLWSIRFVSLTYTTCHKPRSHSHGNTCSPGSLTKAILGVCCFTITLHQTKEYFNQPNKQKCIITCLYPKSMFSFFSSLGNNKCLCSIAPLMCRTPKGFTNCRRWQFTLKRSQMQQWNSVPSVAVVSKNETENTYFSCLKTSQTVVLKN